MSCTLNDRTFKPGKKPVLAENGVNDEKPALLARSREFRETVPASSVPNEPKIEAVNGSKPVRSKVRV
jgi:hypothetical protein